MTGSLNTAWVWQFKSSKNEITGENESFRRFMFEGLKLKASYAYTVSTKSSNDSSEKEDGDLAGPEDQKLETELIAKEWVLLEPTVKRIEDDIPAWEKDV